MIPEGSSYQDIQTYVKKLQKKIDDLDKELSYYKDVYESPNKTIEDINLKMKDITSTHCKLMEGEYEQ